MEYNTWPTPAPLTVPPETFQHDLIIIAEPSTTTIIPGVATQLTYTDTQDLPTTFDFPANAVTQTHFNPGLQPSFQVSVARYLQDTLLNSMYIKMAPR